MTPKKLLFPFKPGKFITTILLAALFSVGTAAYGQIITTVAGNGTTTYAGDGVAATSSGINQPRGIAIDTFGNILFCDALNGRICKVSGGIVTTIGGGGVLPPATGSPATTANLGSAQGLATDRFGNIYFTRALDQEVWKIDATGTLQRIAGNGTPGYAGDGGLAVSAFVDDPSAIKTDNVGNVYFSDYVGRVVRKIDVTSGIISTIAGDGSYGYAGDGSAATSTGYPGISDIAFDASNNLYISCYSGGSRVFKLSSGIVSTYAGSTSGTTTEGIPATAYSLSYCWGIDFDRYGNLYIADNVDNKVRVVNTLGLIYTYAGTGTAGFSGDGGPATAALLNGPYLLKVDTAGVVYFGDYTNERVRKITPPCPASLVDTIAGLNQVCVGSTITLTDDTLGGVWGAANTNASVVGGVVTGNIAGVDTIKYSVTNTCGTTTVVMLPITVNALPAVAAITGTAFVCLGDSVALADATTGGTWSVLLGNASVGTAGEVTGISAGIDSVKYTYTNTMGCSNMTEMEFTINPLPVAGTISGASNICPLSSTTLTSTGSAGGTWSATNGNATVVGGVVTGVSLGVDTIMYAVTNGCGTATATFTLTVSTTPYAGVISGPSSICAGFSTSVSETVTGGAWSATNSNVSIGSTGIVYATTAGVDTIIYTVTASCGSATDSFTITVDPLPDPGSITGTTAICAGSTTPLSESVTGGGWSTTSFGIASVNSLGVVTGLGAGTAVISYTVSNGCGTLSSTWSILVQGAPVTGTISGIDSLCIGGTTTLTDLAGSGSWSSTVGGVAFINTSGDVTASSAGTTIISYTVSNLCGTLAATFPLTVIGFPVGGTISGTTNVCVASSITLTDAPGSGSWSIIGSTATIGTSSGVVTGTSSGLSIVSYTVTNMCGTAYAAYLVTVNPLPHAGVVTGFDSLCRGTTIIMGDTTAAGTWSTSSSATGTISAVGALTGLSRGIETISYTKSNMCGTAIATKTVTVNDIPVVAAISGADEVCTGAHITLTDATATGAWASSNGNATVAAGIVNGVTVGTVNISYTVTNMCGSVTVSKTLTVNTAPASNAILGASSLCRDELTHLADSTHGGTWTISNDNAYLDAVGNIAAITPGLDTVTYTVTNGCGSITETLVVTINEDSICHPVSVETTTANDATLTVFPNPNNGSFTIQLLAAADKQVHYVITNMVGEKIREFVSNTNTPADVSLNVSAGLYFVSAITADGSRYIQKVIVQ